MNEYWNKILVKALIPAFIVAVISTAIDIKQKKAKLWNNFLSVIISLGGAYLSSDYVFYAVPNHWITLVIALIAILTDKFMSWLLYEFKVDVVMAKITDILIDRFKGKK